MPRVVSVKKSYRKLKLVFYTPNDHFISDLNSSSLSSGRSTPSPEQAWTATPDSARNVIDLSKQHMLTLLQEASATLENSTKLAERKQVYNQRL